MSTRALSLIEAADQLGWLRRTLQRARARHGIGVTILLILLLARAAQAQNLSTGAAFYAHCREAKSYDGVQCLAYLDGLQDMVAYLRPPNKEGLICGPRDGTKGDFLEALLTFIRDNPYQRDKPTAELMWSALSRSFPCSRR
jgi:hypothetical protein